MSQLPQKFNEKVMKNQQYHQQLSQPSQLNFKLQKLLQNWLYRQQNYIKFIKQQQQTIYKCTQQYMLTLRQYTNKILKKVTKQKKQNQYLTIQNLKLPAYSVINKYNKKQFITLLNRNQNIYQYEMNCNLTFIYFTPLMKDYLSEKYPKQILIQFSTYYPKQLHQIKGIIIEEEDEVELIDAIINQYPMQVTNLSHNLLKASFNIPCTSESIKFYQQNSIQIDVIDSQTQFIYCTTNVRLSQLLLYENSESQWMEKVVCYSPWSNNQNSWFHIRFHNNLIQHDTSSQSSYKVQSIQPMKITPISSIYGNKQSRMIQRIRKYKNQSNSLLRNKPSQLDSNDKLLLMYQKQKQLQNIEFYKASHKKQYMQNIVEQILHKYHNILIYIGTPKYISFIYHHKQKYNGKIFIKYRIQSTNNNNKIENINSINNFNIKIIHPQIIQSLIHQNIFSIAQNGSLSYQLNEDNSIWIMTNDIICLVMKVILYPSEKIDQNQTYSLQLKIQNQLGQELENIRHKIKIISPILTQQIYLHNQQQIVSQIKLNQNNIQLQEGIKSIYSNIKNIQYKWDDHYQYVNLRIKHHAQYKSQYYVFIYDEQYYKLYSCFAICMYSYQSVAGIRPIQPGVAANYKLILRVYENQLLSSYSSLIDKIRVRLCTSHPNISIAQHNNQYQFIVNKNKQYEIQVKVQTFSSQIEKIIVHAVDIDQKQVMKAWILTLNKIPLKLKKSYKILCQYGAPTEFKFPLYNSKQKQCTFILTTNNRSILRLKQSTILLFPSQLQDITLQFNIKQTYLQSSINNVLLASYDGDELQLYSFNIEVIQK